MSEQVEELVTVRKAAEIAHVTHRTMQRWIEKGAVPTKRAPAGNKLLIPRSAVEPQ